MAQLTYSLTKAGLALPAWIGLDSGSVVIQHAAGLTVTPPVQVQALIDTGCDASAVTSLVLRQLGASMASRGQTQTAAGKVAVTLFDVSLSITDPTVPNSPWLTLPHLRVVELPTSLPDAEVLIGLDVLRQVKLVLDGPQNHFILEF